MLARMPRATPLSADARRAAIMSATEPLLVQQGRNISTRQIADAAGIAEGTIFRVFPTKDALIDAVIEDAFDVTTVCEAIAGIDTSLPLPARMEAAAEILQARLRRMFALFHSMSLRPAEKSQREAHAKHVRNNAEIDSAIADVIGPEEDSLTVAAMTAAALLRSVTFAVTHPILSDVERSPQQIVDVLLYGVMRRQPC
jgi:AcrR family transcriptional regulator